MKQVYIAVVSILLLCCCLFSQVQRSVAPENNAGPRLLKFDGTLADASGKPLRGLVGVTMLLHKDEQGGAPVWLETQDVVADATGHYTMLLGSATTDGMPPSLFRSRLPGTSLKVRDSRLHRLSDGGSFRNRFLRNGVGHRGQQQRNLAMTDHLAELPLGDEQP
jgi:hypothetical protein